jgi:hypothetical protein
MKNWDLAVAWPSNFFLLLYYFVEKGLPYGLGASDFSVYEFSFTKNDWQLLMKRDLVGVNIIIPWSMIFIILIEINRMSSKRKSDFHAATR